MKHLKNNQRGIALMVVLWVLVLLTALAAEFAFSMRTEVNTTRNYKEDVESYFLAKAGINLALAEILQEATFHSIHEDYGFIFGKPVEPNEEGTSETLASEVGTTLGFDPVERLQIPLRNGTVSYKINDENGKANLNAIPRETLVKVLAAAGLEVGEYRDIIADSILDWIDKDDTHKLNGAENDYYLNLTPPYFAKNDNFYSIEELLKVRGITEELLYGTPDAELTPLGAYLGLDKLLTVQDVKTFNPNTAEPYALSIYYDEVLTEEILAKREEQGFYNNSLSTHFKIESTGKINDSQTKHTIIAIVQKFGNSKESTLLIRYWNDNAVES